MVQRLKIETEPMTSIVKKFSAMYEENKLYNYANFITLHSDGRELFGEMCVIMDGSSSDAMVRLKMPMVGNSFSPIIVNFNDFYKVIKVIKEDEFEMVVGDNLTITAGKASHTLELSTVKIPLSISDNLTERLDKGELNLLDIDLVKLYNIVTDVGVTLDSNTLNKYLYGIYVDKDGAFATNGYILNANNSYGIKESFLFPKAFINIAKQLPKLFVKYAIQDRRLFLVGNGFNIYMAEWTTLPVDGVKKENVYPIEGIKRVMAEAEGFINIPNPQEAYEAIKAVFSFSDVAMIYPGSGIVRDEKGLHIDGFTSSPEFTDTDFIAIRRESFKGISAMDKLSIDKKLTRIYCEDGNIKTVAMAVKIS